MCTWHIKILDNFPENDPGADSVKKTEIGSYNTSATPKYSLTAEQCEVRRLAYTFLIGPM